MSTDARIILVAVGHHGSPSALAFAANEARLTGASLHLAHVVRFPGVEPYAGLYDEVLAEADALLAAAAASVHRLTDGSVEVRTERIDRGTLVPDLVRRADESQLVVVEHRHLRPLRRFVTGSTTKGVAARARVPVASVPEDWRPPAEPAGRVTVAVQDSGEAAVLLQTALAQAALHSSSLTVLHASWIESGSDFPITLDAQDRARTEAQVRDELADALAACAEAFPDVEVEMRVSFDRPAEALVDAAAGADLLVLGRRHHVMPWGSHLGPVARTVLEHSPCPVLLAPEEPAHHRPRAGSGTPSGGGARLAGDSMG